MPHRKHVSKRRRKEVVPALGVVGMSLSLAGGASAGTGGPAAVADVPSRNIAPNHEVTLNEEEISDVSLGTFYVFDKENAGTPRLGEQYARRGCGGCGCRGCRGCGRGCRGCGGCGGCGCGGCGCCLSWGVCRFC